MRVEPRPWLRDLRTYQPGSHTAREEGLLASNEASYTVPPTVAEDVLAVVAHLNRYPDPLADELRQEIARVHGVEPEQVLVGNGSDELIFLLTWAFAAGGGSIVCADPAYQLDVLAARAAGAEVTQVPLVDWRHDLVAMARVEANVAYVINPHNPTGTARELNDIRTFARSSRADLVVVDEAYIDFADVDSALPLAAAGEVLVLRTLSKLYALAGARVGYLVGPPEVLDVLRAIRAPFSVNSLAQAAALAAIRSTEHYRWARAEVVENRARLNRLLAAQGMNAVPSQANFVLVPGVDEALFVACAAEVGVAVRPGRSLGIPGAVRITVPGAGGLELLGHALARYCAAAA
ncbi:histidinol-phosphate transaminase [Nocardioides sp. LHD-245]|uniref:pyridoxal phosphate-dependent aminotransferase n=1 Tax=Nocardioides sp. LHD-245 TaxID=3051387 RepID=UPI0027DFF06E|nr:histidinol-phosphate transaminase [Nocardioides sp. LHD-245]